MADDSYDPSGKHKTNIECADFGIYHETSADGLVYPCGRRRYFRNQTKIRKQKNNDKKNNSMKKPELLAPAGDLEKLKTAAHYGADAVYFRRRAVLPAGGCRQSAPSQTDDGGQSHFCPRASCEALSGPEHLRAQRGCSSRLRRLSELKIKALRDWTRSSFLPSRRDRR